MEAPAAAPASTSAGTKVRIGVARDVAFSFYYPENLEELERAGAELVFVSPLADAALPELDALYLGGGFPEVHAARLAENRWFREALGRRIAAGLPVWAECGGLMYLARELVVGGVAHPMVGAIAVSIEQTGRPQGHGYVAARVDTPNSFLGDGSAVRGHEFHYSRITQGSDTVPTTLAVTRGVGIGGGRDGIQVANTLACYTHIHAAGVSEWAPAMVRAAHGGQR